MPISVQCPGCEKKLKVKDELAGKRVKCPACGSLVPIPAPSSLAPPSPVAVAPSPQLEQADPPLTKTPVSDQEELSKPWSLNKHPVWQILGGFFWGLLGLVFAGILLATEQVPWALLALICGPGYGLWSIVQGIREWRRKKVYQTLASEQAEIRKRLQHKD